MDCLLGKLDELLNFVLPLIPSMFLMALAQSAIAAITLAACVVVGHVIFLWLDCTVSMNRSLLLDLMWHQYV